MRIGVAFHKLDHIASMRFRIDIPSRNSRHQYVKGEGDVTILPKHWVTLEDARKIRGPTIWDLSDDHFGSDLEWNGVRHGEYYSEMAKIATVITCTTETLRQRIVEETGRLPHVITDPVEYPHEEPRVKPPKRILWYGHSTNIDSLFEIIDSLRGYELRVVSNAAETGVIPWSHKNMRHCLKWCNAVIIPVKDGFGAKKSSKSPNRMTEAINAGRFVVANDMPAYRGYGMYLGDILEGLEWLERHQEDALKSLRSSQELVWIRHSPKAVSEQWDQLFERVLSSTLDAESGTGTDLSTSISHRTIPDSPRMSPAT